MSGACWSPRHIGRGKLASSNAEQLAKMRRIIEELGLRVATPTEARKILDLKGGNKESQANDTGGKRDEVRRGQRPFEAGLPAV
jgi:hypothetical protein